MLPSPTHFVMHNVIHAFVVDLRDRGTISLRQLFEFVYASRAYDELIDWAIIEQEFERFGYRGALRDYVVLANAYLGLQAPPGLLVNWWARVRGWFYRVQLKHEFAHFLFALGRLLRIGVRTLIKTPGSWKKVYSLDYYIRLYDRAKR